MRIIPHAAPRGNVDRSDDALWGAGSCGGGGVALAGRAGFTLIELLVVVAIIAVLIGLLLPALGTARNASERAACASNMRQIGVAQHVYASDHGDVFLPFGRSGTHAAQWTEIIADYIQRGAKGGDTFNTVTGGGEVFKCPSDTQPFPKLYGEAIGISHVGESSGWLSYAMNSGPVRFADRQRAFSGVGGNPVDDLAQPSQAMHHADVAYIRYIADVEFLFSNPKVGDRAMIALPDPRSHYRAPAPISAPAHKAAHERLMGDQELVYRHGGRMNLLYADGHVALYPERLPGAAERPGLWGPVYQDIYRDIEAGPR